MLMLQLVAAVLQLNASWVPAEPESFADLVVRRGRDNVLTYDDGISLRVQLIDPAVYGNAEDLAFSAKNAADQAGQLALVGGAVPVAWRAALRRAGLSFIDVGGVVEIDWPRLRASSAQFGKEVVRRRQSAPLQKGHALVAEELLMAASAGEQLTVTELARGAGVDKSIASRTVAQLAGLGLVERSGYQGGLHVAALADLAQFIAARTAWPGTEVVSGYAWGRTILDTAAAVSRNAAAAGVDVAVTGRVGAAFLGVLGTSSPSEVRCWARVTSSATPRPSARRCTRASWKRTKATRTGDMHWGRWQPSAGHSLRAGSSSRFTGPSSVRRPPAGRASEDTD